MFEDLISEHLHILNVAGEYDFYKNSAIIKKKIDLTKLRSNTQTNVESLLETIRQNNDATLIGSLFSTEKIRNLTFGAIPCTFYDTDSVEYFNTSSRRWVDMGQDKPIETINKALDTINEALVFE